MARASRARSVGRRAGEMFGRSGREDGSEIVIVLLEGDDSGSKRAERMAESFWVSFEVGMVVVVVVVILVPVKWQRAGLSNLERKALCVQRKRYVIFIDEKEARASIRQSLTNCGGQKNVDLHR